MFQWRTYNLIAASARRTMPRRAAGTGARARRHRLRARRQVSAIGRDGFKARSRRCQTFAAGTAASLAAIVTRSARESAFIFRTRKSFHGRDKVTISVDYQTGDHGFRAHGSSGSKSWVADFTS
jgi:hypothetical protein